MTALRRESSQRVRPVCPHFGLHAGACGGCKMQHLHPMAQVAIKQRVLEDNLWHLAKVKPETDAAADRRPGLGLPPPRPIVGASCGQEGHGAGRFPRAQVALRGRHAGLPGAARQDEPHADAAARADRFDGPARPPAADRTGYRRRSHRAGAAPPGAAERGRPAAAARLRRRARCAVVAAAEGAGQRAPSRRCWPGTGLCAAGVRRAAALQTHRLHAGQCRHQRRAGRTRAAPAAGAARRARDRLVLRPGQLQPAAGDPGGTGAGHRRQRGPGAARARQRRPQRPGGQDALRGARPVHLCRGRLGGAGPGRQMAGRPTARRRLRAGQGAWPNCMRRRWPTGSRHGASSTSVAIRPRWRAMPGCWCTRPATAARKRAWSTCSRIRRMWRAWRSSTSMLRRRVYRAAM